MCDKLPGTLAYFTVLGPNMWYYAVTSCDMWYYVTWYHVTSCDTMFCIYFFPFLIQTLTTPQSEHENKQLSAAVGEEEEVEEEEEGSQDPEVPIETKPSDQLNESGESHDQGVESISFNIVVQISSSIVFCLESTNQSAAVSEFASGEVFNAATRHKHSSTPYGLPCVRELVRFLISIINVRDRWVGHK